MYFYLLFFHQGVDVEEIEGAQEALDKYVELVREALTNLCNLKEFRHVTLTENPASLEVQCAVVHIENPMMRRH